MGVHDGSELVFTISRIRNDKDRLVISKLVQLQKWWKDVHNKEITIKLPFPGCKQIEPILLMNNNKVVAKVSVAVNNIDIKEINASGENIIYFDIRKTNNSDLKKFAKVLTARMFSVLSDKQTTHYQNNNKNI